MQKKKLVQKMIEKSINQAPDNWPRLRDRILGEKAASQEAAHASDLSERRRILIPMKRKTLALLATSAAAAILVITLSVVLTNLKPAPVQLEAGKSVTLSNGSLFINAITPSSGKIRMPPDAETVELSLDDLAGIFGRQPIPTLPEGYQMSSKTVSAIMFRVGTVFMMNGITFAKDPDDPASAQIMFDLNDQGELPISDCVFGSDKASVLEGVEMKLGVETIVGEEASFEMYVAEFVINNIGYRIRASHMTGEEFIAILEAVVKG
jgi:hypothetical protein